MIKTELTTDIIGEISKVVYISDDDSYAVIKIKDLDGNIITVVGPLSGAFEGQGFKATGKWELHDEYGKQFRAETFSFSLPKTQEGIEKYLSSGLIRGIGHKRAKLITSYFKEKTLEVLDHYSARLTEIPGLGRKTLEMIRNSWKEQASRREVTIFFQGLGISIAYCNRIYKYFGHEAVKIVKEDPFLLADVIHGIGFKKADQIAKNIGIDHNDEKRLIAGVRYTLNKLSESGHVCYPLDDFIRVNAETLEINEQESKKSIQLALGKKNIVLEKVSLNGYDCETIYDASMYYTEVTLSRIIQGLIFVSTHKGMFLKEIKCEVNPNFIFNKDQLDAIENISRSSLSIITGGPGVGKTTIVSEIVKRALKAKLKIALAAPTGRAAKRLGESTKHHAQTIHRLLKWDPVGKSFIHNSENKLNIDILVVDESSMLDLTLALSLFKAVKQGTTVVIVGDADQLPSVGPGNVLNDLIISEICPVVFLKLIYRQSLDSRIIPIAHSINEGKMPDLSVIKSNTLSDFYWIEQDDQEKISDTIVKLVTDRIPHRFNFNPQNDIQVLSPMSKGICGTFLLNQKLQQYLNRGSKISFSYGGKTFSVGDKVMQTSNNYDKNVFNGDIGFITKINTTDETFEIRYSNRIISYNFDESDELILAYAITIHKSQGSEFPVVIIPCIMSHYIMLQRNLIYTAVTRAKKLLIVLGTKKALSIAISNYKRVPRYSGLVNRLRTKF